MKEKFCIKNHFTKIISSLGNVYPETFHVKIIPQSNEIVSGVYLERRYLWIFPETPIEGKLNRMMQFNRYWINGIYSVSIKPDYDVLVQIT